MNGSGVKEEGKTMLVLPSTPLQHHLHGAHALSMHGDPES